MSLEMHPKCKARLIEAIAAAIPKLKLSTDIILTAILRFLN